MIVPSIQTPALLDAQFCDAVSAIDSGDVATLEQLDT
jgi:hypothetical protein